MTFFNIVEERLAEGLIPMIKFFILPGSMIISDGWEVYSSISEEGYHHMTVNHSIEFVNKDSGACTNTIESTWQALKNRAGPLSNPTIHISANTEFTRNTL